MCERVFVCVWACVYRKRALFKIRRTARRHIANIVVVVAATKKFSIVPSYTSFLYTHCMPIWKLSPFSSVSVFFDLLHNSIVLCCLLLFECFWWPISFQFPHISHIFFWHCFVFVVFCFHLMLLWFILILNDVVGFVLSFLLNYVCGCVCGFLFFVIEF